MKMEKQMETAWYEYAETLGAMSDADYVYMRRTFEAGYEARYMAEKFAHALECADRLIKGDDR